MRLLSILAELVWGLLMFLVSLCFFYAFLSAMAGVQLPTHPNVPVRVLGFISFLMGFMFFWPSMKALGNARRAIRMRRGEAVLQVSGEVTTKPSAAAIKTVRALTKNGNAQ